MINKRYFIITLFVLIFGCNSDSDIPQNETGKGAVILFGGKITNIVSKAITEGETFPSTASIGIFSWGHNKNNATEQVIRKDLNNTPYTKSSGSNDFISTTEAHYSVNPDTLLNFYAYYPYNEAATATPLSISFDLTKQNDIMWATPVLDKDKTTADQKVNFSFNHILSAITLIFKKADDIKEDMILQSVSMENYPSTIQLNVQTGELSATASTSTFPLIENLNIAITPTETTVVTNFLLYPVDKPVFIVRMSDKDYRIESKKGFEKGKRQTYTFTIQASDISLSGSITPWADGGTSNETVYF